ncbi:hypothetical protein F4779DRAFT_615368 [Xylariaceae sp. FL0662B]|nr:hypothetical protein F4779DRAFT_615368 [Xylariaceae sp. FL0662B]
MPITGSVQEGIETTASVEKNRHQPPLTVTLTSTGLDVRLRARNNILAGPTPGLTPTYVQANLVILPSRYADDFCLSGPRIVSDCDIRRYNVYRDSRLVQSGCLGIVDE